MIKTPKQMAEEAVEKTGYHLKRSVVDGTIMLRQGMDRQLKRQAFLNGFLDGYQAAKDELADADKVMLQWISVKERLPEVGTWCLWMYPTGPEVNQYEGKLDDGTMLFHRSWYDSDDEVTYWMPLPEPPKENK